MSPERAQNGSKNEVCLRKARRGMGEARREPTRGKGRAGLLLRPAMSPCGHTQMKLMPMSQEQLRPAGLRVDLDGGG